MKEVNNFQRLVEGIHARLALPKYAAYFRKTWLQVVVLIVGGFVVHLPALQGEPIWDDDYLIRTNPFVKSPLLILETFRHWLFPESYASHYRPVQNIIYMGDYFLWNNNFYGFHLSSVLFHVGSAVLLYFLLRKLLPSLLTWRGQQPAISANPDSLALSLIAFLVALLWVVHPVHSAAVDYVSGRADSLALFFALGGWLLFLKAREISRPFVRGAVFTLAWSSGVLSLCSRESGCILMALFLLYLFVFEKSTALRRKCIVLVACLSMFGLYARAPSFTWRTDSNPAPIWPECPRTRGSDVQGSWRLRPAYVFSGQSSHGTHRRRSSHSPQRKDAKGFDRTRVPFHRRRAHDRNVCFWCASFRPWTAPSHLWRRVVSLGISPDFKFDRT